MTTLLHISASPRGQRSESLAIAATLLGSAFAIFNFLTYGTTAQVARLHGAGHAEEAAGIGGQATWLALGIGAALTVVALALAGPAVAARAAVSSRA